MDFKRKQRIKQVVFSYTTIFALSAAVILLAMSVYERYQVEREMAARKEAVEEELQQLRVRAAALEADVEYLTDERGIEAEIRNRFDVAKEGEQVVIILDDEPLEHTQTPTTTVTEVAPAWYEIWR